ncbi:MAG: heavy-metal-associated domain-containing protein [Clostridiales bacterium]|nr:heavy-metal-associated domain-containing protein [Clostridiales bacterium]
MTRRFKLVGLDCPVCASKIERAVKAIDGVASANVNFLTERLTVEFSGDLPEKFADALKAAIRKANPDTSVRSA